MRVDRHRIRLLYAAKLTAVLFGEQQPAAVSRIDVKPQLIFRRDLREFVERVDHAARSRSGCTGDADGSSACRQVFFDRAAQLIDAYVETIVGLDLAQVVAPDA